jgi:hypothetical protein
MKRTITIHTLESIMARTVEEGECLLWTGYFANKVPMVSHAGKVVAVRRLILELSGKTINPTDFASCRCKNKSCVLPAHIELRTKSQHSAAMGNSPNRKENVRAAKLATTWRESGRTKITIEIARAIRCSSDSGPVESKRYGIDKAMISRIRRGEAWREFSTPFSGLGAR